MFVHHPEYVFEDEYLIEDLGEYNVVIDRKFIDRYYSGSKNNAELFNELQNKSDVLIVLPEIPTI